MWKIVAGLVTGFVVTLLFCDLAFAHMARPTSTEPLGWAYPYSCCSGNDCAAATLFRVRETPQGYKFTILPGQHQMVVDVPFSDVIPYRDGRIKDSPDGLFHVCVGARYQESKTKKFVQNTICLFVPPRSF